MQAAKYQQHNYQTQYKAAQGNLYCYSQTQAE
jgi:hypothetical protein